MLNTKDEELKTIEKLQEIRKKYVEIDEVQISQEILNKIFNQISTSSNFGQNIEGIIFGRYTDTKIIISQIIPGSNNADSKNLSGYLDTSRLDSTKIGFYFCDNGEEILNHNKLKTFIEFQKSFPNCVILYVDINAFKSNIYPFVCFRLSNKILDIFEEQEIEENANLDKEVDIKDFYKQMFKKLNPSVDYFKPLKLNVSGNIMNIFENLAEKEYVEDSENNYDNNYYYTKDINYNLNQKMKDLNRQCEKLIEDQKKLITYTKMKRNEKILGKEEIKKGIKTMGANTGKAGANEEKFDLIDFGLHSQNIKEMNKILKNILNKRQIDSFTAYNLSIKSN